MTVLPQTPLDWVLVAVALARVNNPRIRAFQDISAGFAVTHFGVLVVLEAARRIPLPRTSAGD